MSKENEKVTSRDLPQRRPYVAPKVISVDLAAEEVLARGCKISGENALGSSTCAFGSCKVPGT